VRLICECPRISITTRGLTPCAINREAQPCRRSWKRNQTSPPAEHNENAHIGRLQNRWERLASDPPMVMTASRKLGNDERVTEPEEQYFNKNRASMMAVAKTMTDSNAGHLHGCILQRSS
jgi:hypothetical protein